MKIFVVSAVLNNVMCALTAQFCSNNGVKLFAEIIGWELISVVVDPKALYTDIT